MPKKPSRAKFNQALGQIAGLLLRAVRKEERRKWARAYVEELFPPEGGWHGGLRKFRWELPDGTLVARLHTPLEAAHLMEDAWELQHGLFPATWYGLKVIVFPDGKWEAEYDYDRDCLENRGDAFLET